MENSEVNEAAPKYNYYTIEDYLAIERESVSNKYELHEGALITMQGASRSHVRIVRNLISSIDNHLQEDDCEVFSNDLKVAVKSLDSVLYPDLVISCDESQTYDDHDDILLNPVVIIEVLSPSTEKYDRNNKFSYYQHIDAFREYILVDSTKYALSIFSKSESGKWLNAEIHDLSANLTIQSINFTLPLSQIYRRVSF